VDARSGDLPVPEWITATGLLDLDDLCAEVREHQGQLVPGDETGEIQDANTVQETFGLSSILFPRDSDLH
jgi:hypothetical protein